MNWVEKFEGVFVYLSCCSCFSSLLGAGERVEFVHGGDEDVAGFVAVLGSDDADFFEPDGEAGDEAVALAEVGLEHGGGEFALA